MPRAKPSKAQQTWRWETIVVKSATLATESWWTNPRQFYERAKAEADRMAGGRFGGPTQTHNWGHN